MENQLFVECGKPLARSAMQRDGLVPTEEVGPTAPEIKEGAIDGEGKVVGSDEKGS